MYLAHFEMQSGPVNQGMVHLPGLLRLPAHELAPWWEAYARLIANLESVDGASAAMRFVLKPGSGAHQALLVAGAEHRAHQLQRFLATFIRLQELIPGSVRLPAGREQYDAVADDMPPVHCAIDIPAYDVRGAWLACDFRVADGLASLAAEADAYGYRFAYQVNVGPWAAGPESIRIARRNLLIVRELAGVPGQLVALQQQLADGLQSVTSFCREYVAVDAGPPVRWLTDTLSRRFRARFESLGFATPDWDFVPDAHADAFATPAVEGIDASDAADLCGSGVRSDEVKALLGWQPPESLLARYGRDLPAAYAGEAPFLFVSYKRDDLVRIAPVIHELQAGGWNLWYDRGIVAGERWERELENRLQSCCGVLLFVSQAAVDSERVQDEVAFARDERRPIVPVQIEDGIELRHGLKLSLSRYQMLDMRRHDFAQSLREALPAHCRASDGGGVVDVTLRPVRDAGRAASLGARA